MKKREETMHRLFRHLATGLLLFGALSVSVISSRIAQAQATAGYPARPVKIVVPFAPAGPTDVMARLIAQKLGDSLGKQFYVENHPGAGGNLGMALVANAPPDGYTLLLVSSSVVVNPSLYEKVPYDVYKSLAPVTLAGSSPNILVVHPSVPAKNVKELIAYIHANPGKVSFASPGFGTTASLAAESFKYALKLDIQPVPFNGAGPALNAVVAGQVQIGFMALPPVIPHLKAGTLHALALTTEKRVAAAPDVPTMAEAGVPGDQISDVMQAVFVPAGTPKPIIDLLQREIAKAVATPDVKSKLDSLGFDAIADTPEHFAARIKMEVPKWAKVIEAAKIEKVK
jgi:tripartite-type tricarboxylate transporter receptor subunit TctC